MLKLVANRESAEADSWTTEAAIGTRVFFPLPSTALHGEIGKRRRRSAASTNRWGSNPGSVRNP